MKKTMLFLLIAVIANLEATAQMYATRNAVNDPFLDTNTAKGFFPALNYSHEFSRGYGSAGEEQAWNGRAIGIFEFYRWENDFSLGGIMAAEAAINSYNDIGFNPRSIRWMEELTLYKKQENFVWEIGVQHQCKHDVDNSDGPRNDSPDTNAIQKRVNILSGLHAAVQSHSIGLYGGMRAKLLLRGDYYFSASDYRFPDNASGRDITNAGGALLANGKLVLPVAGIMDLYVQAWAGTVFFTGTSVRGESASPGLSYRAELGADFRGSAGKIDIFVAHEHFFDDLSSPVPQSSNVVYLGIRGSGKFFF